MLYNGCMRKAEKHTSFRLTAEAKHLLETLAQRLGISQTAVVEIALRKFAEQEQVYGPHRDSSVQAPSRRR